MVLTSIVQVGWTVHYHLKLYVILHNLPTDTVSSCFFVLLEYLRLLKLYDWKLQPNEMMPLLIRIPVSCSSSFSVAHSIKNRMHTFHSLIRTVIITALLASSSGLNIKLKYFKAIHGTNVISTKATFRTVKTSSQHVCYMFCGEDWQLSRIQLFSHRRKMWVIGQPVSTGRRNIQPGKYLTIL